MFYLALHMVLLLSVALLIGVWVGGWVAKWHYARESAQCLTELAGLRRNYQDATADNAYLRSKTRQLEKVLRKIGTPPAESEYGEFLELRKTLEKTRREYQVLLEQYHQQEKILADERREWQRHQQALVTIQTSPLTAESLCASITDMPPPLAGRYDDLTRIQGISQQLASHLKALGIVTYRQVAEFTTDDMQHIQRIIGTERYQPPEGWVQNARALC
ncbi:hypothetical protein HMY34_09230 [Thiothrix subterranea]|uniref:hypothetical protein n=1 Tax=Thiothrix subterranea TaxID=2735563 RepID=UPI00192AA3C4|nr:hypothetical protein [Thiothrix subterranea]QQZ28921.1 hypothetical protein HMY34_09230 [Thiothrix subterranea]